MGLETEIVGPDEIKKIAPITNTDGIIGALYDPLDGHLDPSGTTHAYAKAARMGGATIETHCMVRETNQRPDGTWDVVTDKGTIHAEHVVNAGGLWAREVGAMAGIYFPLHPMEHQYLVTDSIPEIEAIIDAGGEHPHVMDPAGESYLAAGRARPVHWVLRTALQALGRGWNALGTSGTNCCPTTMTRSPTVSSSPTSRFPGSGRGRGEIGHPRAVHFCA